ncbi:MAG TPA: HXXEE domain-containing protein [Gemmatimonadaceae bacterium]|nr:HXXEE domain-containing protein [Gemmatimonadaceae bacterium]
MTRRAAIWLVPLVLAVHNAEEAIAFHRFLPRLATSLPGPLRTIEQRLTFGSMLTVLALVTLVGVAVALWSTLRPGSRLALWSVLAVAATIALNVGTHVVSAIEIVRGYAPGLVTAVLVNAPFVVYLLRRAARERWLSSRALLCTIPAAVVLHGPVLVGTLWLAGVP